jgi:3'-phosphoadenosine 5'-phosphosulfate sulfotransferase (PAPS reductase)/FAD synthetase
MTYQDHFKIISPTCISFSGGRTSAYMLWRVLQSNDGLPKDAVVCFANTGEEDEATLRFVQACSERWNVPINWLEYQPEAPGYKIVTFETAARNGEPFETLIKKRNYLPNPVTRFCTAELKIRPMGKFLFDLGLAETKSEGENISMLGFRADEPMRAAKVSEKERIPLVSAGITKADISAFWSTQPFDLQLPNNNGVTMHGNCDLCFLKGASQILSLIEEKPDRAIWWARMENTAVASKPSGAVFRFDRPSYSQMANFTASQRQMFDPNEEAMPCYCGD